MSTVVRYRLRADLPAFRAFQAGLGDRCEVAPDVAPAEPIGRYGQS